MMEKLSITVIHEFKEGYDAFFRLLDLDENPYTEEVQAFDWKAGWKKAEELSNNWNYKD